MPQTHSNKNLYERALVSFVVKDKTRATMPGGEISTASPTTTIDFLPDELLLYIFRYLPLEGLLECEHVCSRWRKLAQDSCLWKNITMVYSGKPGHTEASERNLRILTTHSNYVCGIKLQYVYNYSLITTIIDKCPNLISLELVMCRLATEFQEDIKKWRKLKRLNLKNSLLLQNNPEMLIPFEYFRELTFLGLSEFGLSPVNFSSLMFCTHLSHIFIEKIKTLTLDNVKELIISKQRNLVSLHLYGGLSIDDKCLQLLQKCPLLRDLAIIRCESLTDEGLLPLANFIVLQHLQIWNNTNFTELGLLSTLGSPNLFKLKSLSLSRIKNIYPVIVDVISEYYKELKFLALYQCPRIINTDYEKQLKSKFRNIDVVLY